MTRRASKTSLPPSCAMNPKPFASLNHFTVPFAIASTSMLGALWLGETRRGVPAHPPVPPPPTGGRVRAVWHLSISAAVLKLPVMATPGTLTVRTFLDRTEGLAHLLLRADQAPRLLAFDDVAGCPVTSSNASRR